MLNLIWLTQLIDLCAHPEIPYLSFDAWKPFLEKLVFKLKFKVFNFSWDVILTTWVYWVNESKIPHILHILMIQFTQLGAVQRKFCKTYIWLHLFCKNFKISWGKFLILPTKSYLYFWWHFDPSKTFPRMGQNQKLFR